MMVPAPTDKRFRRAHVSPARRRRWFAVSPKTVAYAAVGLACLVYVAQRARTFALSADVLTVQQITIRGNARLSREEVLPFLDGLQGRNMLLVNLDEWRTRLLTASWVADAALRRVFPGTIDVAIAERLPMGIGRVGTELYLIDERGEVIDRFGPEHADLDLPVIDGLSSRDDPAEGRIVDEARAALATRLLISLQERPELAARISQVDVTDRRNAIVLLKGDTTLIRVGDDQFSERLQSYLDLAPTLRERVPGMDYVDLRFGDRVYVRPHASGPRTQKGSNGG